MTLSVKKTFAFALIAVALAAGTIGVMTFHVRPALASCSGSSC